MNKNIKTEFETETIKSEESFIPKIMQKSFPEISASIYNYSNLPSGVDKAVVCDMVVGLMHAYDSRVIDFPNDTPAHFTDNFKQMVFDDAVIHRLNNAIVGYIRHTIFHAKQAKDYKPKRIATKNFLEGLEEDILKAWK